MYDNRKIFGFFEIIYYRRSSDVRYDEVTQLLVEMELPDRMFGNSLSFSLSLSLSLCVNI